MTVPPVPVALRVTRSGLEIGWVPRGRAALREPFFHQNFPPAVLAQARVGPLSELDARARELEVPGLQPAGFIFQTGRCGSTLLCQMLAGVPGHLVAPEPKVIRQFLEASRGMPRPRRVRRLRLLILALSAARRRGELRFFLKFTSIDLLHLDLVREAFPQVPWIFLHREPLGTLSSFFREPPLSTITTARRFGIRRLTPERFLWMQARLLAMEYASLRRELRRKGRRPPLVLDYEELRAGWPRCVERHFGFRLKAADRARLRAIARLNAKDRGVKRPHASISPGLRLEATSVPGLSRLRQLYAQLNASRGPR